MRATGTAHMAERRKLERYRFAQGYGMRVVARDGSWQVPCTMIDVTDAGAKLHLDAPVDGIEFKDFVLKLSEYGTAERNCELMWHRGEFIGVRFVNGQRPPLSSSL